MKKASKLISVLLALVMCLSCITPAFAFEQNPWISDVPGGTAETPVVLNAAAATFSVTIPTGLPVEVLADGTVVEPDAVKIINNSAGAVKVENVAIEGQNDWVLVNFDTDPTDFKVNEKKIGLQLNSANEKTAADGSFAFDASKWGVMTATDGVDGSSDEYEFTYDAILAPQSVAIANAIVANVIFTIGWDKVEYPVYLNQPYNGEMNGTVWTFVFNESNAYMYASGQCVDNFVVAYDANGFIFGSDTISVSSDKSEFVFEGVTFKLNLEKHDLYFGAPYSVVWDDGVATWILNEDGSEIVYWNGAVDWSNPAGTFGYGDNTIVYLENGDTFYVSFDGTQIIIWDGIYELAETITFTIDGVEYEAIEGMTWYTWANSDYNTGGYECIGEGFIISKYDGYDEWMIKLNGTTMWGRDVIVNGGQYELVVRLAN